MTEAEWAVSEDPQAMLEEVRYGIINAHSGAQEREGASARKLHLFACAFARMDVSQYPADYDENFLAALEVATQAAEEIVTDEGVRVLLNGRHVICPHFPLQGQMTTCDISSSLRDPERGVKGSHLLRDIFHPFRPWPRRPAVAPEDYDAELSLMEWHHSPTVRALADTAYEHRTPEGFLDPARLAVLSDALEEAGCDVGDLLQHLRGFEPCPRCAPLNSNPEIRVGCGDMNRDKWGFCNGGWIKLRGPCVRGCWALDLITGRT